MASRRLTTWLALLMPVAFLTACQLPQPSAAEQANICEIFEDRGAWYRATRSVRREWGAPISVQMAIMQAESAFDDDARPERGRMFFGLLPGARPSSAYGYAQAVDSTWDEYRRATGNNGAERDDFDDAIDFIGWYMAQTERRTGVPMSDGRRQYLAYHEGWSGYNRGTWRSKAWLDAKATRVGETARRYEAQLDDCANELRWHLIPLTF